MMESLICPVHAQSGSRTLVPQCHRDHLNCSIANLDLCLWMRCVVNPPIPMWLTSPSQSKNHELHLWDCAPSYITISKSAFDSLSSDQGSPQNALKMMWATEAVSIKNNICFKTSSISPSFASAAVYGSTTVSSFQQEQIYPWDQGKGYILLDLMQIYSAPSHTKDWWTLWNCKMQVLLQTSWQQNWFLAGC